MSQLILEFPFNKSYTVSSNSTTFSSLYCPPFFSPSLFRKDKGIWPLPFLESDTSPTPLFYLSFLISFSQALFFPYKDRQGPFAQVAEGSR